MNIMAGLQTALHGADRAEVAPRRRAGEHPLHGFRRAWPALRFDEHRDVNKKKVPASGRKPVGPHPPSAQNGLANPRRHSWTLTPRKCCGRWTFSSTPLSMGKAVKIASMIDEHTRVSALDIVERSITSDRLVIRAGQGACAVGRAAAGAADGQRT